MGQRIGRIFFFAFFLPLLATAQLALLPALPDFFRSLHLPLIIAVLVLFFSGFRLALWTALVAGFWLDIFSFSFFGMNMLSLCLAVAGAKFLSSRWLTNRSLYSFLLLMLAASAGHSLLIGFLAYFVTAASPGFFLTTAVFWSALFYQMLGSGLSALLSFNLVGAATRRLQPFFLENK